MAKKRRRHRRFNGMGSMYMMPGHRARPWAARVIKERREDGKYSYAYTFHETAVDAVLAIPEMLKRLKETPQSDLKVNQIWERFKEARYPKLSASTIKVMISRTPTGARFMNGILRKSRPVTSKL